MAQVNITLSQEEVLQVFAGDRNESIKFLFARILNEIMRAESEDQLGAAYHERSDDRKDYRNGIRERELNTRIGTITLEVPRHRSQPFHTMVFENYSRSEAALIATMVQMVVCGVSTRKVSKVVEALCGTSFSKSTVSELCRSLDKVIDGFRNKPLEGEEYPFLMLDATYFKAREEHRIVSRAFLVALGITGDGKRQIIGFDTFDAEDSHSWNSFLGGLRKRGLGAVCMITSDSHKSIRKAIHEVFPEAAWQKCQVHFMRNILDKTAPKHKEGLRTELREMFTAATADEARKKEEEIIRDYSDVAAEAMDILENGFDDSMTVMELPGFMRPHLRSTNKIERLNREFKRRSDVIHIFPNSASVTRLMGAVAIEYNSSLTMQKSFFSSRTYNGIKKDLVAEFLRIARKQQAGMTGA